ncbi:MAG: NADH-quinone oxidoreductase subunit L [bacterium]|nr:NADH-quinone oxidoreductase subunit L [bacterium]
MIGLAVTVWLLPLASFALVLLTHKKLPRGGDFISLGTIFTGLAISLWLFAQMLASGPNWSENWSFQWIPMGKLSINFGIHFDILTSIMLIVVTLVSSLVHLFSTGYMKDDPKYGRFFAYLSLFSFSMLGLVLADSLIGLYIFWELVGLSSYLLIGFWHEKNAPAEASKKAFLTNRVGDVGMLLGILMVFFYIGDLNLQAIYNAVADGKIDMSVLTIIGLLLFCGAIGKSAQFPLHVWLPDAMEGPTPVSALIHAATMVAAGVYLVARIFPIITPDAGLVIATIGGFTAFFAATIAVAQHDIKKVLAYSTISQLGYMILGLGVGAYTAGLFHLVTHAFFKACLFLASGSVIHAMHHSLHHIHSHADPQDMRNMGGMKKALPITYWTMLIATLAISGVPFTSGFLSKDAILGSTLAFAMEHGGIGWLLVGFGFVTAGMTAFYMFRIIFKTFHGTFQSGHEAEHHLHESPKVMTIPLLTLATLSVFFWFTLPNVNPFSTKGWFSDFVATPQRAYAMNNENKPTEREHLVTKVNSGVPMTAQDSTKLAYLRAIDAEYQGDRESAAQNNQPDPHPGYVSLADQMQAKTHGEKVEGEGGHGGGHEASHTEHTAHLIAMILSLIVAGGGIYLSYLTFFKKVVDSSAWKARLGIVYQGMLNKWWFDELYSATVIKATLLFGQLMAWFDGLIIDGAVNGVGWLARNFSVGHGIFDNRVIDGGVNGLANTVGWFGRRVRLVQTGDIQRYLLSTGVVVGVIILVVIAGTLL